MNVPKPVPYMELYKIHIIQSGDRLDILSNKYLKSPKYWKLLAAFNGILDPENLIIGAELKIPTLASAQKATKKYPDYLSF